MMPEELLMKQYPVSPFFLAVTRSERTAVFKRAPNTPRKVPLSEKIGLQRSIIGSLDVLERTTSPLIVFFVVFASWKMGCRAISHASNSLRDAPAST